MSSLSLLGVMILILANVFLSPGSFDDVRVGFGGMNAISQTHLMEITESKICDNYVLDSKDEEDPKYSVISVRPDKTNYLNVTGSSVRGLFDYTTSGGDNLIIMADKGTVYKSSGTRWTTLETGFFDAPWESNLYYLPNINRLYMCNGIDKNKKFYSGRNRLFNMQNQDQETLTGGHMYFTSLGLSATGDSTAINAITPGQYVKAATTDDDVKWVEVVTKEGTSVFFSTKYLGTTGVTTLCVRSNDLGNSRHMIEYEGHEVLGYMNYTSESSVANSTTANYYQLSPGGVTGVAQSFTATKNTISKIGLYIARNAYFAGSGNLIIKVRSSLTGEAITSIVYPVENLSYSFQKVYFSLGSGYPVDIGSIYYVTIELEDPAMTPGVLIGKGTALADGNAFWTYSTNVFSAGWNTGLKTIEVSASNGASKDDNDTHLVKGFDPGDYGNYSENSSITIGKAGSINTVYWRGMIYYYLNQYLAASDINNFINGFLKLYTTNTTSGVVLNRIITPNSLSVATNWYRLNGVGWVEQLCGSVESDYTATGAITLAKTISGYNTFEVTAFLPYWATGNYGIKLSPNPATAEAFSFNSSNAASNRPIWSVTSLMGSTESGGDLYIDVQSSAADSSTIIYSKRFKPENFPTLNTFNVPGTIVGLAKTGGYLIVGTERPDALHIFNATYDTADGAGIKDTTRIDGLTFGGGSHSIAYLPKDDSFIFYSGLGVYMQKGLVTTLLSGKIRDEIKGVTNYRDPLDYYGGYADIMPQAVIDPTKDTYFLAVPKSLGVNSYLYNYNYANDTWTRWTHLYPTVMLLRQERAKTPTLYFGDTLGQVTKLNKTGSITQEAILSWFFSGKDITKKKQLSRVEMWGRADNPLTNCLVTMEVQSTNPVSSDTVTTAKRQTIRLNNNSTTDAQVQCLFSDIGLTAREFKITLTQSSSVGAISWRVIKYKGSIIE